MFTEIRARFERLAPGSAACWMRLARERNEILDVRRGVLHTMSTSEELGALITVAADGGVGYAATSDLSTGGLQRALDKASQWAQRTVGRAVHDARPLADLSGDAEYETPVVRPWRSVSTADKIDLLMRQDERLGGDERIVEWEASLWHTDTDSLLCQAGAGSIRQHFEVLVPCLRVLANEGTETIERTFGGFRSGRQGGLEVLDALGFDGAAPRVREEALAVLAAPPCPTGTMDVVLAPDQMVLQIHESIGHPLELDRILGDERNYAGTSFVTLDMFGSYRYGSELLNVTFDPTRPEQMASYGFDDEGTKAERAYIIRGGMLERPLGGALSQARAGGIDGVANARMSSWNRPPIDRMANLNMEPGTSSLDELIAGVERGLFMETNTSWSIDDSRNKFQFGCELARTIEHGELGNLVKKPGYRGISSTFWRSLTGVGDASTLDMLGTPYCGKGEPNQMVRVGHATPAARFADVDVFGGA